MTRERVLKLPVLEIFGPTMRGHAPGRGHALEAGVLHHACAGVYVCSQRPRPRQRERHRNHERRARLRQRHRVRIG